MNDDGGRDGVVRSSKKRTPLERYKSLFGYYDISDWNDIVRATILASSAKYPPSIFFFEPRGTEAESTARSTSIEIDRKEDEHTHTFPCSAHTLIIQKYLN